MLIRVEKNGCLKVSLGVETYTSTIIIALDVAEFSMASPVGLAAGVAIA